MPAISLSVVWGIEEVSLWRCHGGLLSYISVGFCCVLNICWEECAIQLCFLLYLLFGVLILFTVSPAGELSLLGIVFPPAFYGRG